MSKTLFTLILDTSGSYKSLALTLRPPRLLIYELHIQERCCRSSSCLLLDVLCSSYQHKEWNNLLHGCSNFPTTYIRESICEPSLSHPPGDSYFCSVWLRGPSLCLLLQFSFPEVFPVGSISTVQNLFGLSTDEIAGLKNDFLTYLQVSWLSAHFSACSMQFLHVPVMQDDLGISVEASVESSLDLPTSVYIAPAPSGEHYVHPAQHANATNKHSQDSIHLALLTADI